MSHIDVSKIKLSQLRTLAAVVTHGSFGKASVELNVAQSSVSHSIAALEESLGVSLLFRSRQGASLTPVGQQVMTEIRAILRHLDQVVIKAEQAKGLNSGQVRVGCIRSLATYWLPQALAAFKEQYPDISVTVTTCFDHTEVQQWLRDRRIDVGLMDIYDEAGFTVHFISQDDYVALVPKSAPFGEKVTWTQLAQYPLIMPVSHDEGYDDLRAYVHRAEVRLNVEYEINEDATIVRMVAQELGIAILPRLAALPIPDAVKVCQLPVPLNRDLVAAILTDALHSPAVFSFMEMVQHQSIEIFEDTETSRRDASIASNLALDSHLS